MKNQENIKTNSWEYFIKEYEKLISESSEEERKDIKIIIE